MAWEAQRLYNNSKNSNKSKNNNNSNNSNKILKIRIILAFWRAIRI